MRPVNIRNVGHETDQNRVAVAVAEGDGDIQDLTTIDGCPIQDGSTLELYAADWSVCKAVYRWVGKWAYLTTVNT